METQTENVNTVYDVNKHSTAGYSVKAVQSNEHVEEIKIEPRECPRCNTMFRPLENQNREHCMGCLEGWY